MTFVDTHTHLYFPEYDDDREQMILRAREAGVKTFVNVGTDVDSSKMCLDYAKKYEDVYATAGIHPHDAKDATPDAMDEIEALLAEERVLALGEIGLDYFHNHSTKETQQKVLRQFFAMYQKSSKPLVIHCRDAYEDFAQILKEEISDTVRGVMHCFSSDKETMKTFLDLGFHISFAGPLTYKKNDELREACIACPEDRLLFETDAPFLAPQAYRGKRNETAYIVETLKLAAEIRKTSLEALGEQTTRNACRLFGIKPTC